MNAALKLASFASNQKYVKLTPVLTMALLEAGNISHIIRMWVQHSSEGTSLVGLCCINFALILWWLGILQLFGICLLGYLTDYLI